MQNFFISLSNSGKVNGATQIKQAVHVNINNNFSPIFSNKMAKIFLVILGIFILCAIFGAGFWLGCQNENFYYINASGKIHKENCRFVAGRVLSDCKVCGGRQK